ncbi:NADH-quinone oxidoreductase subunit NuoN [Caldimonas thermodepolymerans]|uniref:NADH-quinone oxidoreductase subunit N n=1 Tax=Caldimonas thermodepolymerans TaxID=215580 RepID=A0A2S5T192_9BURK|nr:NADH-quinone oxidoreductase subunit NuoN [Caldimonas thermodepolymerans]PPE68743.1 NADH-quinone oxidoreductase subunit NuoN [Caldimonas thermodepolymerans]QPC30361.1 NADH-quinone oxidoreductase subunit NuoN [Caldimonas thermodepolymerans]RDH95621.1 NADH dehydrogenase subunit N [Caldimonas thermodepolymerans]TCP03682.1 NADH dehydrogenase subunit N [Caldimonas thermodepolymerans]UZG46791.1 NADH-quinone oxidoreductase subunit NuoN [Caldimonas thermodepolymerans]
MNDMNWLAIYPEILLLVLTCVVALVDLFVTDPRRTPTYVLTLLSLVVLGALQLSYVTDGVTVYGMQGMVVSDPMGNMLELCATIATLVSLVYARPYAADRGMLKGELFTLSLFSLLGIMVLISANNFLTIYLGLELMSLSLYALVALRRDDIPATEAAMKYFVLGALASGFLLYGLSMMYGATGSLELGTVLQAIGAGGMKNEVLVFGVVFVVAGLAFKLAAVPFHMWVPDVYQGAPTAVTLLISGAPQLAGFAMAFRLLVEGMAALAVDWQQMLIVLAVASLVIGNLVAIAQTNLKRMLAYSTIGQMGFVLLGLACGVMPDDPEAATNAYSSALFYTVTYVLTTLGTFGLVALLAREGFESDEIADLKGLNQRSPWYAAVMAIFMFSLAGVPPAVGFYAKLAVLQALVATAQPLYIGLAIAAVLLSLIGAFYYLRVVKVMYFDAPADAAAPITASGDARAMMSLNGLAVLVLGLLPGGLMAWCTQAISQALAG